MEQPTAPIVIELRIQWSPQTGQIGITWPQVDDVVKLGLLAMATQVLTEARVKAGMTQPSGLVVPAKRIIQ